VIDVEVTDLAHRSRIAPAHARRTKHAHVCGIGLIFESREQSLCAFQLASDRVANPNGGRRRRWLAFFHDVKVRIERRDLINGCLRQSHLGTQRPQVPCGQVAEMILKKMKELDQ
jgi:hypothetical protein